MGYLDNSSVTVDAILTRRGRELLSRNDGSFRITQFALGDDEIDYTLYNENHPDGSQFFGEAIENLPLVEAFPDENNIPRPEFWSGWKLNPIEIEFWLDGQNRIHERLKYIKKKKLWEKILLSP